MGYVFHCDASGTFSWFPRVRSHSWTSPPWPPAAGLELTSLATSQFRNLRAERDPQLSSSLTNTVSSSKAQPPSALQSTKSQWNLFKPAQQTGRAPTAHHQSVPTANRTHRRVLGSTWTSLALSSTCSLYILRFKHWKVLDTQWATHTHQGVLCEIEAHFKIQLFFHPEATPPITQGPAWPFSPWCHAGKDLIFLSASYRTDAFQGTATSSASTAPIPLWTWCLLSTSFLTVFPDHPITLTLLLCTRLRFAHSILIFKSELYINFQITSKALSTTEAPTSTCWALQLKPQIPKSVGQLCITCASSTTHMQCLSAVQSISSTFINQSCHLEEWNQVYLTRSIFHKSRLSGTNYISTL